MNRMRLFKNKDTSAMFLIMEGIVYTMVLNLYNPFTQMFAKRMGGGAIHTAMINAIPPLVAIFALLPGSLLIERLNRKKKTVLRMLAAISIFYASIAFVPTIPHEWKVFAFVILIGLMNCPGSLYLATWQSYFADNFEGSYASRIYTVRSKYSAFFGLITVLVTGLLLSNIPTTDEERLFLYQIFYGICFLLTLLQIFLFSRVKGKQEMQMEAEAARLNETGAVLKKDDADTAETDDASDKTKGSGAVAANKGKPKEKMFRKEDFSDMLRNKPFLVFCLCSFVFHLSWQMAWPLFFIYYTDYAYLDEMQLSLLNVAAGLTQFLSFSLWNKLIDKKGSSLVVVLGAAGLAVTPFVYTAKVGFAAILGVNIFSGVFQAAFNIALFLCLLETLPQSKKTVYISVFNTLTSFTGFIAPFIGLWIYNHTNIYLTMGIAGTCRIIGSLLYLFRWIRKSKLQKFSSQNIIDTAS